MNQGLGVVPLVPLVIVGGLTLLGAAGGAYMAGRGRREESELETQLAQEGLLRIDTPPKFPPPPGPQPTAGGTALEPWDPETMFERWNESIRRYQASYEPVISSTPFVPLPKDEDSMLWLIGLGAGAALLAVMLLK